MTFETPPLKLPQIIMVPAFTTVRTPLEPEVTTPVRNFTDRPVSSNYSLPLCPMCWSGRTMTAEHCVLLQSRPLNGD